MPTSRKGEKMKEYVIAAFRHTGLGHYAVTLWGPDDSGYTPNLDEAGVYDESVLERFKNHLNDDFPIELNLAKRMSVEREYNYSGWKAGHFILNDEMFRNTFGLSKKIFYKCPSDKQYYRFKKDV
jgi:hypothetical protein